MSMSYTLSAAVERIESVSAEAQIVLRDIILETKYRKQRVACFIDRGQEIEALEGAGLIVRVEDPEAALLFLGRNELVKRLSAAGVAGFKKNSSCKALVEWCIKSGNENVFSVVSDVLAAVLAPGMRVWMKAYVYLSRKYDSDKCYDPESDKFIEVPKGATFYLGIRPFEKSRSLRCEFPDDDITQLLDQYGCNRCRTWGMPE